MSEEEEIEFAMSKTTASYTYLLDNPDDQWFQNY